MRIERGPQRMLPLRKLGRVHAYPHRDAHPLDLDLLHDNLSAETVGDSFDLRDSARPARQAHDKLEADQTIGPMTLHRQREHLVIHDADPPPVVGVELHQQKTDARHNAGVTGNRDAISDAKGAHRQQDRAARYVRQRIPKRKGDRETGCGQHRERTGHRDAYSVQRRWERQRHAHRTNRSQKERAGSRFDVPCQ